MDVKEILEKLNGDSGLLEAFKKDPAGEIKKLVGELPKEELDHLVAAVKAKVDLEKVGDAVEGAAEKLKGLFGK